MFDMSTPFSTFNSDKVNGAGLAIMQREMDIEGAAHYLADLYFDDVDIDDEDTDTEEDDDEEDNDVEKQRTEEMKDNDVNLVAFDEIERL